MRELHTVHATSSIANSIANGFYAAFVARTRLGSFGKNPREGVRTRLASRPAVEMLLVCHVNPCLKPPLCSRMLKTLSQSSPRLELVSFGIGISMPISAWHVRTARNEAITGSLVSSMTLP